MDKTVAFREPMQVFADSIPSTDPERSENLVDRERVKCDQCDASFGSGWGLRRHIAGVHEKSRNFTCEFCPRTFKQSGYLHEHMSVYHAESGGHACEICGKRFGVKSQLLRHVIQKHTDVKQFECRLCHTKYKDKHGLDTHTKRKHAWNEGQRTREERNRERSVKTR
mmetsp:Transcript_21760/g.31567  ORF Transcript_21760/g.31567 Transcript_21760/m.31567 type:complete len:167 (+) Transcript_21760:1072-1572(+)